MKTCKWNYVSARTDKKDWTMQKITEITFYLLIPISIKTYKKPFKVNFISKGELEKYIKEHNDPEKYIQVWEFEIFGRIFQIQKGWNPFVCHKIT